MTRLDEATLHALVDGQLSADEAARVEVALQNQPEELARVQAWRAQRAGLQRLGEAASSVDATVMARLLDRMQDDDASANEAVADALVEARVVDLDRARQARQSRQARLAEPRRIHLAAAAAMAAVAACLGWFGHAWTAPSGSVLQADAGQSTNSRPGAGQVGTPGGGQGVGSKGSTPLPAFVREASSAYAVFTPEVRHPVEVTADEQTHLVQWLSRRLGRPLKVPDLNEQGYQLLGGRLLPANEGAGAMFMYQNATGERMSLYMTALSSADAPGDTAFRFSEHDGAQTFYWVDKDFGYAVSAKLPRDRIMTVARSIYAQTVEATPK